MLMIDSRRPRSARRGASAAKAEGRGLMIAGDLYAEMEMTQRPLGPASFTRFHELGIPNGVIFGDRPLVGVARIVPHSSGLFEFHDEGEPAIIVVEGAPEAPDAGCARATRRRRPGSGRDGR